ncbi:membrane protein [Agromyces sp. NBRC 114283]|nr:membrane protein [Agromyces sp. NBRC 114283]
MAVNSVAEMREAVFFDGQEAGRKASRFWLLLGLSAVIAAAGLVGDSAATVIGAMIVAPLMTPILGTVLATVIGDRRNLVRSWAFVLGGAAAAIAVGYLVGLLVAAPVVASTDGEIASRVSPGLIAMLAALATGAVGAIALVRRDVSDTLPGVAIAISLVPPLATVGLTLESGAPDEALGALLLFATNVAAIIATGVIVLAGYRIAGAGQLVERVRPAAGAADGPKHSNGRAIAVTLVTLALIAVPLTATSVRFTQQELLQYAVRQAAEPWAAANDLVIERLDSDGERARLQVSGRPPAPDTAELATALEAAGVDLAQVTVEFIPTSELPLTG